MSGYVIERMAGRDRKSIADYLPNLDRIFDFAWDDPRRLIRAL